MTYSNHRFNAEHERLSDLISLYYNCNIWLACWCRHSMNNESPQEMAGFTFQAHELKSMNVDCDVLFSKLIAGDIDDPWVKGTLRYDYMKTDGTIGTVTPGADIDGLRILRLHFEPDPHRLPYAVFINALAALCDELKLDYRKLLFRYHGVLCEDPMRVALMLNCCESEADHFIHALNIWHTGINTYLNFRPLNEVSAFSTSVVADSPLPMNDILYLLSPHQIHRLDVNDQRIRVKLAREDIAKVLGVSTRTLHRWEQRGETSNKCPWPPPEERNGNHVMYYLPRYLKAMQSYISAPRDTSRDRQLRAEISELNHPVFA